MNAEGDTTHPAMSLKRGCLCYRLGREYELKPLVFIAAYPEANAVKVKQSGEEWILKASEILPAALNDVLPLWLSKFIADAKVAPKKKDGSLNKAALARLHPAIGYSRVLKLCSALKGMGLEGFRA